MYWALQYVGRSEDKIQYNYKVNICFLFVKCCTNIFQLHVSSEEYEHRSMTFVELCCDDLRAIDEIIGDDFCVAIPLDQLETYGDKYGVVWYQITIQKV